jgi:hypothetical protein
VDMCGREHVRGHDARSARCVVAIVSRQSAQHDEGWEWDGNGAIRRDQADLSAGVPKCGPALGTHARPVIEIVAHPRPIHLTCAWHRDTQCIVDK